MIAGARTSSQSTDTENTLAVTAAQPGEREAEQQHQFFSTKAIDSKDNFNNYFLSRQVTDGVSYQVLMRWKGRRYSRYRKSCVLTTVEKFRTNKWMEKYFDVQEHPPPKYNDQRG